MKFETRLTNHETDLALRDGETSPLKRREDFFGEREKIRGVWIVAFAKLSIEKNSN